ncbi:MAG: hypothetical protein Q4G47_06945, partial [Lachnospiraceae bacterium]|nr:hypothetical protein [Lachnospiraceae bacterium]
QNDLWRQEFEEHIRNLTRRNVEVEFHMSKSRPQNVRNVDVEKMINEGIRITVETDDSEDEEI